jgi:hypothetical protein
MGPAQIQGPGLSVMHERFYVGNRFLGDHAYNWFCTNGDRKALLPSELFFCPLCGEVWGRRINQQDFWVATSRPCRKHGSGSLLHDNEDWAPLLAELPRALLEYELSLEV